MHPSASPGAGLLVIVAGLLAAGTGAPAATPAAVHWTRALEAGPEDAPTALASAPDGRIAVGGARGVRTLPEGGIPQTLLRRGPVSDLAFLADGSLLAATAQGLYRVHGGTGRSEEETLAADTLAREVSRLAAAGGSAAAATPRGVFLRGADARWQRARALPSGPASVVALRARGAGLELWSVSEGELWIVGLGPDGAPLPHPPQRLTLPVPRGDEGAVDVDFGWPGADAVLGFPTALAARGEAGRWRVLRPALPPGARIRRIARGFDRLWLATDAGLLTAARLDGPWERAAPPLGSLPVVALAGGGRLLVATHRGVHLAEAVLPRPAARADAALLRHRIHEGPTVGALHRAVIRQQGLDPAHLLDMRRRALRRGWLPELQLSVGYQEQRDRSRDADQTFSSGDTRQLFDTGNDLGRDLDFALTFRWDLGDTVFHPDEIDVSREARSVISLRDDVLDEVTQLYFERLRVLSQLEVAADASERQLLALRAAELTAGLDAWTGGRFSGGPHPPPTARDAP